MTTSEEFIPIGGKVSALKSEDWWSVWIGVLILILAATGLVSHAPKIGTWTTNPLDAYTTKDGGNIFVSLLFLWGGLSLIFMSCVRVLGGRIWTFLLGFTVIMLLAEASFLLEGQVAIKAKDLPYALWALLFGLLISNTVGVPGWLLEGVKSELYIKTGLVLLGAEILFGNLVKLGPPGLFVGWTVVPICVVFMYWFGVKVLGMSNRPFVMVIAASTSVCGVSAAIAAAAASKATKEDLTLGVGMTMIFTVLMMIVMPGIVQTTGMDLRVGAAWLGGTIDATGAVVAAAAFLGDEARDIAAVVKMIQNILIGVIAFAIALFWVTSVERDSSGHGPSLLEVWVRLPKFILGFVAASLVFSFALVPIFGSPEAVEKQIIKPMTANVRGWLFCMAFVAIGLESNFKALAGQMIGGKPIYLYLIGQTFNLALSLLAAWLAFGGILFERVSP
ncbi:MAG: hypothetical protein AMXMBFR75_30550 [Candidatus Hinthialibacteria bacterium]